MELHIFDFDGTLVKSPLNTPENRAIFEKHTGIPWFIDKNTSRYLSKKLNKHVPVRRGWFGRRETLESPLVPDPAPKDIFIEEICQDFLKSKKNQNSITVLMTGRHAGLISQVLRICSDGNLVKTKKKKDFYEVIDPEVCCWFLGQNGPAPKGTKPNETLPWKIWIIEQYLEINPDIKKVIIWEDREEHVTEFKSLNNLFDQNFEVIHVKSD